MATDNEIVAAVRNSLGSWALGDIFKAVRAEEATFTRETDLADDGALRGAFILCSCLVDAMTCYRYNRDATRTDFKNFVHEYLGSTYNGIDNDLYFSMRCGMVHNYQPMNLPGNTTTKYKLTHNQHEQHLVADADGVWLNLQDVIFDVREALNKFFGEVETEGSESRARLLDRAKRHGWFGVKASPPPATLPPTVAEIPVEILADLFDTSTLPADTLCYGPSGNVMPSDL